MLYAACSGAEMNAVAFSKVVPAIESIGWLKALIGDCKSEYAAARAKSCSAESCETFTSPSLTTVRLASLASIEFDCFLSWVSAGKICTTDLEEAWQRNDRTRGF